jgi:hypothetical protein
MCKTVILRLMDCRYLLVGVISLAIAGCGGSEGSGEAGGPDLGGTTFAYGNLSTRGFTNTEPIVMTGSGGTAIGMAGNFGEITYRDTSGSLDDGLIAYSRHSELHVATPDFSSSYRQNTSGLFAIYDVKWNYDGSRIYFRGYDGVHKDLFYAEPLTQTVKRIQFDVEDFDLDPFGPRILYIATQSGMTDIFACNADGGEDVKVTSDALVESRIRFIDSKTAIKGTGTKLQAIRLDTGANLLGDQTTSHGAIAASSDRRYYAFYSSTHLKLGELAGENTLLSTPVEIALPNGLIPRSISFTPDNKGILLGGTSGIYRFNIASGTFTALYATTSGGYGIEGSHWQPFGSPWSIVGIGGKATATSAAGFIYAQRNNTPGAFGSLVVMNCSQKATARLTGTQPPFSSPYLVYTFECNAINLLTYTVSRLPVFTPVISTGGAANGAVISINSTTGAVASIMPYKITRSGKAKVTFDPAGGVRVEGDLLGVWDGEGTNVAPGGGSQADLDAGGRLTVR